MVQRVTVDSVIAGNMKRLRVAAGLSQADLAELGPVPADWTRDTVTAIEVGRRAVSMDELLGLCWFFQVGLSQFFMGNPNLEVELDTVSGDSVPLSVWQEVLVAPSIAEADLAEHVAGIKDDVVYQHIADHDPTAALAGRLGVTHAALNRAARRLWGQSVKDEYEERFLERTLPERMVAGSTPDSRRTLANIRGHVVRALQKELAEKLNPREER